MCCVERHWHRDATMQKKSSPTVSTSLLKVRLSVRCSHSNLPWPDLQWCIISISLYKSRTPFLHAGTSIFIRLYVFRNTWLRSYACVCLCERALQSFPPLQLATCPAVGQKLWQPRQWQPRVIAKDNSVSAGVTEAVQWPGKKRAQESL